jgi:hypothetical protein
LKAAGTPERALGAARYFKTGPGEYGEGDIFLGVAVPLLRKIALRYRTLSLDDLQLLLQAKEHEVRVAALEILVVQHKTGDDKLRKEILAMYLRNTQYINWPHQTAYGSAGSQWYPRCRWCGRATWTTRCASRRCCSKIATI